MFSLVRISGQPDSLSAMNLQHLEFETAYELVAIAVGIMEHHHEPDDLEAAVVAVLACALEIASERRLRPIHELFQ